MMRSRSERVRAASVSAIVVAFEKEELLHDCLHALGRALGRLDRPAELIVVVNGLHAAALADLRARRPATVLVEPGRNLGFAGGVKAGLAHATGDWIALVNDDCVVEPDAILALLDAGAADDRIGSVAAQIRFADRPFTINSAGLEVDGLGVARERLLGASVDVAGTRWSDVFGASAATALYRRAMLDTIGGFDDTFLAYLEDADVAWRARMAGWRCVYAPAAVVWHRHSTTLGHGSRQKHFLVGRNRVRMLAKNATRAQLLRHGLRALAYDCGYVAFVAANARTLAPLRGRLTGLSEWRVYRARGRATRQSVRLAPPSTLRQALRRNRVYGEAR